MRRLLALGLLACAIATGALLADRGPGRPHLTVTPAHRLTACASSDCGGYAVTLRWGVFPAWGHTTTGYNVLCTVNSAACNSTPYGTTTGTSYTVTGMDCGQTYTLGVQAHDSGSDVSGTVSVSYPTPACPSGGSAPTNTVQPYFTASTVDTSGNCTAGCAIEGQQLQVTTGTWAHSPTSYSYQWQDCTTTLGTVGALVNGGSGGETGHHMTPPTTGSCSNATGTGATTSTYTVGSSDAGKALAVQVTATNAAGGTSTSLSGSCNTGLDGGDTGNDDGSPSSNFVANGVAGCSPVSAVVGASQTAEKYCTNAPITCGFGDIASAGVPAGTTLYNVPTDCTSPSGPNAGCGNTGSGWSYSSSTHKITVNAGGTLQDVAFVDPNSNDTGTAVSSPAVALSTGSTLQDSDIEFYGDTAYITTPSAENIVEDHNNLHGESRYPGSDGSCDGAAYGSGATPVNFTFTNNNVWYCSDPVNRFEGGGTIGGNYLHGLGSAAAGNHFEDMQLQNQTAGQTNVMSIHNNTIFNENSQTAGIILSNDDGGTNSTADDYRTIVHNLFAGGGYCFYAKGSGSAPNPTSLFFETNRYSPLFTDIGCSYGPDANGTAVNTWSGNEQDATAATWSP